MKKLLTLLACALLMAGCSNASAKITDGSSVLVSVNNKNYTREDLYSFMSNYGGSYFAITNAQKVILDAEVEVTEEMTSNVDATLSMYQSMLGDSFEPYLQSQGFAGIDAYREMLIQNEQLSQLYVKYVEANYEALAEQYTPKQIQLMQFDNEETAKEALDEVNNGGVFENIAQEKGSSVDGSATIITNQSSYETVVSYTISTLTAGVVSDVVSNDDGSAFYIVKVIETDAAALKDQAINVIASISAIANESIQYYFKEYDFHVYDIDLYTQLQESYSDLLNQ